MNITQRYVLDYCSRYAASRPGVKVLDYGCGEGAVVIAGRKAGLDILGADVFYPGSNARDRAKETGLLGSVIVEFDGIRTPFQQETFDLIVNNQVMEHVEDLNAVLAEIHRILKPGGVVLSLFPARDVMREGHIGIPFSHWFPRGWRLRFYYTWLLRCLGFGYWKQQARTRREWALQKLEWIDRYTRYRPRREILAAYNRHFRNRLCELDYIRYRLRAGGHPFLAVVAGLPLVAPIASELFRRLGFLVIVSAKEQK